WGELAHRVSDTSFFSLSPIPDFGFSGVVVFEQQRSKTTRVRVLAGIHFILSRPCEAGGRLHAHTGPRLVAVLERKPAMTQDRENVCKPRWPSKSTRYFPQSSAELSQANCRL